MALKYNEFMLAMAISTFSLSATVAHAQNIDTAAGWDGSQSISSWGVPDTATYGQTITANGSQTGLRDFTFYLNFGGGAPVNTQAFVYAWDPVGLRLTGNALFASDVFTAPSTAGFSPVLVQTGGVSLNAGSQYVLFLTTSTAPGQSTGSYTWGTVSDDTYAGGTFVYQNNATDFASLGNRGWDVGSFGDLAFKANSALARS